MVSCGQTRVGGLSRQALRLAVTSAAWLLTALPLLGGEIYVRETFEAANATGRVLPSDTTGIYPPKDIGNAPGSCFFAHDQGMIGAGLAGSKLALRGIDSSDGQALRADWTLPVDKPVPAKVKLQFDLRLTGLAVSERVKSVVPFTLALRDHEQRSILTTMVHNDRPGSFAVRTRSVSKEYELHGDGSALLANERDYRFVYTLDLSARRYTLTVIDPVSGGAVIAPEDRPLPADLPAGTTLRFVSVSFGAPDFASSAGAADQYVTFDNLLVCDPDVTNGLDTPAAGSSVPADGK